MCFRCEVLSLTILLFIPVSGPLGETVSCSPQTVCALRESVVNLMCSYSDTVKPQRIFWFSPKLKAKWRNEEDPEDLALDSDYAGRVNSTNTEFGSTLTITDLRERDSGEYHLLIVTGRGERRHSSTVRLTVSDLQVKVSPDAVNQSELRMTCSTSCTLTSETQYHWYKNGQELKGLYNQSVSVPSSSPGSFSCSATITSHNKIYSSPVCFGENCWNVSYSDRRLCVLEGSSVDFLCTYSHPSDHTVNETFWYYTGSDLKQRNLTQEEQFAGRTEFLGDKEGNCSLRMRDVRKDNSGEYYFRFIINNKGGRFTGSPAVVLTVTDLQVRASPSSPSEGQTVTLTCSSTCTLPNNPTYIWYKNGEPVTNKPTTYNKLYLESASSEDIHQYSCALGDRDPKEKTALHLITAAAVVFLALLVAVSVWIWRRKSSSAKGHRSPEESGQCNEASGNQDDIHYSSIQFRPSHSPDQSPSITSTLPLNATEEHDVQYADVKFSRCGAAPQPLDGKVVDDSPQIYSQIQKRKA